MTYDSDSHSPAGYHRRVFVQFVEGTWGLEMFEQELELEKRSSWGPLLLVLALVGSIIGLVAYYAIQLKKGLPAEEATAIVETQLRTKMPSVHFRSGKVIATNQDEAKDPHYRLLEKAGYLKLTNVNWNTNQVVVTEAGDKAFAAVPGFKKWKNPDNTWSYELPLASRKLVKIDSIVLNNPNSAKVEYEWKWEPNSLGNLFDAGTDTVKTFNTWDRQKLIDRYGADFYHADAKKEALNLAKGDKGWAVNTGF